MPSTKQSKEIFLLGAGGMGMLPLAIYLKQMGYHPLAYDDAFSEPVRDILERLSIPVLEAIPESGVARVVYSSAILPTHPVYRQALALGIPLEKRGAYWAELIQPKKLLAVVGSHGKTTSTGMLIDVLDKAGFSFSYLLGGLFNDGRLPARYCAESDWVVSEVDESDRTWDQFSPTITLAVNFDWDHVDAYSSEADLANSFLALFQRTKEKIIVLEEETVLAKLARLSAIPFESLGFSGTSSYCIRNAERGKVQLRSPTCTLELEGSFNAKNASLALAAASTLGISLPADPLKDWKGIYRRQATLYESKELSVFADYAHHPRELKAILALAQLRFQGPQTVVFQPHRYSRTAEHALGFAEALSRADAVFLLPVYSANEPFLEGGTSLAIKKAFPDLSKLQCFAEKDACLGYLKTLRPKGTLVFIGAGDIYQLAQTYVSTL